MKKHKTAAYDIGRFEYCEGEWVDKGQIEQLKKQIKELQNEVDYYKHEYFSECDLREKRESIELSKEEYDYLINMLEFEKSRNIIHKNEQKYVEVLRTFIVKLKKQKELNGYE